MFFSKKKELVPCNCFEDKVKCETCKCWLDKKDAQKVRVITGYRIIYDFDENYCEIHKKPYIKKIVSTMIDKPTIYIAEKEVDEKGNVIKQK